MVDFVDAKDIAKRAKAIYAERLRATLEPDHLNEFVAIEPDLAEYFLGGRFPRPSIRHNEFIRVERSLFMECGLDWLFRDSWRCA